MQIELHYKCAKEGGHKSLVYSYPSPELYLGAES